MDHDYYMYEDFGWTHAIAEEGKVFTFDAGKLIALDAKTGKRLWTYGKSLTPHLVYRQGDFYGLSGSHKPYAVNAKTGKAKWQSGTSTWIDTRLRTEVTVPTADTLYVIKGSKTFAFDAESGKLRWKADEPLAEGNGSDFFLEEDGVVLRTFLIAPLFSSGLLNAYDKKTGKKLWGQFGHGKALGLKDGIVYSADYDSLIPKEYQWIPDRKFIVNAFNLKTGEKTGSREYNWTLAGDLPYRWGVGNVWMSGDKLYIEQDDRIAEYDFDAYRAGAAPLRTFSRPSGENGSLPRIVQDHLIYRNSTTGELTGIRLKDGQTVSWRGDAPASQIDVYGKGVYLAQRNGTLLGLNTLTTEPVFKVKTGADLHASTLKTGDMFIIQAEGKLIGVKLPKELR